MSLDAYSGKKIRRALWNRKKSPPNEKELGKAAGNSNVGLAGNSKMDSKENLNSDRNLNINAIEESNGGSNGIERSADDSHSGDVKWRVIQKSNTGEESIKKFEELRRKFEGAAAEFPPKSIDNSESADWKGSGRFLATWTKNVADSPGFYYRRRGSTFRDRSMTNQSMNADDQRESKAKNRYSIAVTGDFPYMDEETSSVGTNSDAESVRHEHISYSAPKNPVNLWRSMSTRNLPTNTDDGMRRALESVQRLSDMRTRLQKSRESLPTAMEEESEQQRRVGAISKFEFPADEQTVRMRRKGQVTPASSNQNLASPSSKLATHSRSTFMVNTETAPGAHPTPRRSTDMAPIRTRPTTIDFSSARVPSRRNTPTATNSDMDTVPNTPSHPDEPQPSVLPRRNRPVSSMMVMEGFPGDGPRAVAMRRLSSRGSEKEKDTETVPPVVDVVKDCKEAVEELCGILDKLQPPNEETNRILRNLHDSIREANVKLKNAPAANKKSTEV